MKDRNFFYTVEPIFEKVTEQEYYEFIKNYPRELDKHCSAVCDPPLISYNDFELANRWPYSMVAQNHYYDDDPESYYYLPKEKRYFGIMVNYEEVFNSRTGNKVDD